MKRRSIRRPAGPLIACAALLAALAASGARAGEPLVTEGFINAPVSEVWRLFTTSEGYKATGVAQASVDLRIGGEIRSRYAPAADSQGGTGAAGGEPCSPPQSCPAQEPADAETIVNEILAYEPERMLAIRVKQAPASFPHREAIQGTWSVIYFHPAGENMTQVRIVGLGYRDDADSQALRKFFAAGNRWTLDHIAKRYWPKCARCEREAAEGSG